MFMVSLMLLVYRFFAGGKECAGRGNKETKICLFFQDFMVSKSLKKADLRGEMKEKNHALVDALSVHYF